MQPVTVLCREQDGLNTPAVRVEVYLGPGLPGLHIVGLVETAIKESRDRVRAAILSCGFTMPDRRIVVSLAPADLPKQGSRYDLAIAIGILCASEQVPAAGLAACEMLGELSLAGQLQPIPGALPAAIGALAEGNRIILPRQSGAEAGLLRSERVLVADSLSEVTASLTGKTALRQAVASARASATKAPDLLDVQGQPLARRALELAATGGHHLLMSGPPGTGKSMLASRLPGILPPLSDAEALETAAIYSLSGSTPPPWQQRPFRAPHHSATAPALAGGSADPRPGEVSLAHNGVLFLDELPEFSRHALEMLREPLETGSISIARARRTVRFPARFQLIAAMNPCPCGYRGDSAQECRCTREQVRRYAARISGPFMDRIDIAVSLRRERLQLSDALAAGEPSAEVRVRVLAAIARRDERGGKANALLDPEAIRRWCWPDAAGVRLLEQAADKFSMSRRACDRTLRLARSIADLAHATRTRAADVAEALSLRYPAAGIT